MSGPATPEPIIMTRRDKDRLVHLIDYYSARSYNPVVDFLDQEITRATIVESEEVPRDVATMNSRVTFRDSDTGSLRTVSLVYPGQEDSALGRISILSPVGTALIGLSEGQAITWETLDGRRKSLSLIRVVYQPEAVGRFDL